MICKEINLYSVNDYNLNFKEMYGGKDRVVFYTL